MLLRMIETRFISHALRTLRDAVSDILGRTQLNVRTDVISKRLAHRTRAQLKALEQMLRRVIMLIAIGLSKEIVLRPQPRPRIQAVGLAPLKPLRMPRVRQPKEPQAHLPPLTRIGGTHVDLSLLPKGKPGKPVNMRKLLKRIRTLQRVLDNPQPMARRLATHYARLKALHVYELPVPPEIPLKRPGAELSLVAGALPMEIARAARAWQDTS